MPFADVGSERLYYEVTGEGPPLVLIRGLSRSLRFWSHLTPELAPHFSVITYDHRGIGRSPIVGGRFTIRDLASDLDGLLEAIGVDRAHVFGLSLGGMVALQLALHHAGRVDKLVLGATSAGVFHRGLPRIDTLGVLGLTALLPLAVQVKLQAPRLMSPRFCKARPDVARSWVPFLETEPRNGRVIVQQALAGALHQVHRHLAELTHEVLILTGDADRLIPHRNSLRLAERIPGAQLSVLPGVGHDIAAEAPDAVIDALTSFLLPSCRRQQPRRRSRNGKAQVDPPSVEHQA